MNTENREPSLHKVKFICPHCEAFAEQRWYGAQNVARLLVPVTDRIDARLHISQCQACQEVAYWRLHEIGPSTATLVWPQTVTAPRAHPDMPDEVREIFEEARNVQPHSVRAAAGLLRLALQELLVPFGDGARTLDKAIQAAVDKGLAPDIAQMAMDIVRVRGNDNVHPSELSLHEDPELLPALFMLVNLIVDRLIGEPARVEAMYQQLPPEKLAAIRRRAGEVG